MTMIRGMGLDGLYGVELDELVSKPIIIHISFSNIYFYRYPNQMTYGHKCAHQNTDLGYRAIKMIVFIVIDGIIMRVW